MGVERDEVPDLDVWRGGGMSVQSFFLRVHEAQKCKGTKATHPLHEVPSSPLIHIYTLSSELGNCKWLLNQFPSERL